MGKVTLKEMAKVLNLSVSTVSKALNDSHEISDATKRIVKKFAKERNYQPNPLAKYLKLGRSNSIGVILPSIGNPFHSQIIESLHNHASLHNFNLIIMQSKDSEEIETKAIQTLLNQGIDGIIISPAHDTSNIALLKKVHESTCPVIIFDRINYDLDTYKIGVNNFQSGFDATVELIKAERRKIVILCGKNIGVTKQRLAGYEEALTRHDIEVNHDYIVYCNYKNNFEDFDNDLKEKIASLMKDPSTAPNAIFGTTDTLTTRVLGILADLGIQVPNELAVIGFANTEIANSLNPALSTIRQPTAEIASLSIEMLIRLITTKKNRSQIDFQEFKLDSSIQLRKSTDVDS
ncbi:LacI family DNA-binding transcriptional regulator [Sphingobacterium pedocola]|uniref:LacI family transcriptional regulator n=1 Tax=Sphingobacterium pedocola TaxID=2082722 RepID=A0ABR9T4D1_9SPHI|nr:LacI family DNA-binding transcriptional regulator [Sphingobacterium pedocola]MBE8720211.1 LacI family transcriptional regulator [Sphingobacterium pedocola]